MKALVYSAVREMTVQDMPEPRPRADLEPGMLALHRQITERNARILYRGTGVESFNDSRGAGLR